MPSASRPWLLRSGKSHRPGSKLQHQIRRALIAARGPVSTTGLIAYCYPRGISRQHRGAYRNIWKAAIRCASASVVILICEADLICGR
jgi:hypothetical protein